MTTLLIDGDILVYRAAFAAQAKRSLLVSKSGIEIFNTEEKLEARLKHVVGDFFCIKTPQSIVQPARYARQIAKTCMSHLTDCYPNAELEVFLSGSSADNFRVDIQKDIKYKANRVGARPVHYEYVRQYLMDEHNTSVSINQEADDCMGIAATLNPNTIICTIDKDLDMIPGVHYNFVKKEEYTIDDKEAIKHFYTQLLTGDRVDNIPGLPQVGPKTAEKILNSLDTEDEMYYAVRSAYKKKGYSDEYLLETARMLWIRREENQLWEPPRNS